MTTLLNSLLSFIRRFLLRPETHDAGGILKNGILNEKEIILLHVARARTRVRDSFSKFSEVSSTWYMKNDTGQTPLRDAVLLFATSFLQEDTNVRFQFKCIL